MASEFDHDPFTAKPSPYAASSDYLSGSYEGPARPETHPFSAVSLGVGAIALAGALIVLLNALVADLPGTIEVLARLFIVISPVLAIAAIVTGHIAFVKADRANLRGRGPASTGFIFGYASLLLVFVGVVLSSDGSSIPGIV